MHRVSSRQRLVSWDAFDASTAVVGDPVGSDGDDSSLLEEAGLPVKRKRSVVVKTVASPPDTAPSLPSATGPLPSGSSSSPASCPIPAYDWEYDCLSSLNDDLLFHILQFCTVRDLRQVVQVNHRYNELLLSPHATSQAFWLGLCRRKWSWIPASTTAVQVETSTTPSATASSTATSPSYPLLLTLAAQFTATVIDESFFHPCRWSRSLRRFRPRTSQEVELETIPVPEGKNYQHHGPAIHFTGRVGSGDRSIRTDQPLSRPLIEEYPWQHYQHQNHSHNHTHQQHHHHQNHHHQDHHHHYHGRLGFQWLPRFDCSRLMATPPAIRPFVAPWYSANGTISLLPRLVSYFEVEILSPVPATHTHHHATTLAATGNRESLVRSSLTRSATGTPPRRQEGLPVQDWETLAILPSARTNATECIAVGLANGDFSVHTRMPGWDHQSFGYHSDDGGIFHGAGSMIRLYGPTFGAGDIIGCGIDYMHRAIFYTRNGEFLGYAFEQLSLSILQQDWYPVVGMDSHCPVICNLKGPFTWDLKQYNGSQPYNKP